MGMTIDDSERYLRLMLGGMKDAVRYWEDKDKEESDIEQTNVEAVETALDTMRKYQIIVNDLKACEQDGMEFISVSFLKEIVDGKID